MPRESTQPTLVVMCSWCKWSAQHTGDTLAEVAGFLRYLLIAHCEEHHADKATAPRAGK